MTGPASPTGTLLGEDARVVTVAINTALGLYGDDPRTPAQRRADGLVAIARFFLDNNANERRAGRNRPHVSIVVPVENLGRGGGGYLSGGAPISGESVSEALCDSEIHRIVTKGASGVLEYGRSVRTVPNALYDIIEARDQRCRAPGCDRPSSWCHAHHIWHWEDGGPTNASNLVLLCARHHHLAHKQHWEMSLADDGTLTVTLPNGRTRTTSPPNALSFAAA